MTAFMAVIYSAYLAFSGHRTQIEALRNELRQARAENVLQSATNQTNVKLITNLGTIIEINIIRAEKQLKDAHMEIKRLEAEIKKRDEEKAKAPQVAPDKTQQRNRRAACPAVSFAIACTFTVSPP